MRAAQVVASDVIGLTDGLVQPSRWRCEPGGPGGEGYGRAGVRGSGDGIMSSELHLVSLLGRLLVGAGRIMGCGFSSYMRLRQLCSPYYPQHGGRDSGDRHHTLTRSIPRSSSPKLKLTLIIEPTFSLVCSFGILTLHTHHGQISSE